MLINCENFSFIPIGMLSEEASEARNKDFRNVRMTHTRKIGWVQTNLDIIHIFLISSEPYISHIKPKFARLHKQLFPETSALILNSELLPLENEEIEIPQRPKYQSFAIIFFQNHLWTYSILCLQFYLSSSSLCSLELMKVLVLKGHSGRVNQVLTQRPVLSLCEVSVKWAPLNIHYMC